jgi:hypothetical protein
MAASSNPSAPRPAHRIRENLIDKLKRLTA